MTESGPASAADSGPEATSLRKRIGLRRSRAAARPPASADAARVQAHSDRLIALIEAALSDDQAEDVVTINLTGKSSIGDYMVIATGRSGRHVSAMADHLVSRLKDEGFGSPQVEGLPHADWVLIDAGDAIIHLFRAEVRAFYNLERIWADSAPPLAANG